MITVYVLRSLKDERLYVGMTENLDARLKRHQAGQVPSTKYRRPFELIYHESLPDRTEARKREKYFKSGLGHKELHRLLDETRVPTVSG
jgi:putative endonuclease